MASAHHPDVKDFQFTHTPIDSGLAGSDGAASFYKADLDKVQRKLNGIHVQMYVRSPCLVHIS